MFLMGKFKGGEAMIKYLLLLLMIFPLKLRAQEQLCSKIDTVIGSTDGSLFLRLEGIKRSFYTTPINKESSLISMIAIAKAHEMKICLEGFGEFEESRNRQSFRLVRMQ